MCDSPRFDSFEILLGVCLAGSTRRAVVFWAVGDSVRPVEGDVLAGKTTPADAVFPGEPFAVSLGDAGVWATASTADLAIGSGCGLVGGAGFALGSPATIGPAIGFRGRSRRAGSVAREQNHGKETHDQYAEYDTRAGLLIHGR